MMVFFLQNQNCFNNDQRFSRCKFCVFFSCACFFVLYFGYFIFYKAYGGFQLVISILFLWIVFGISIFIFVLQYYARTKLLMRLGSCRFFSPRKALDLDSSLQRTLFWWGINALGVVGGTCGQVTFDL